MSDSAPTPSLKPAETMPGSFGWPIVGESLSMALTMGWGFDRQYQKYGSIFKTSFLGKKYAVVVGPDAVKSILQDQADRVSSYLGMQMIEPFFGQPMLLQDGETHRTTRKLMAPAFHGKAIVSYFDTMQQIIDAEVNQWEQHRNFPLFAALKQMALQVGVRLFLGVELVQEVDQVGRWYNTFAQVSALILKLDVPITPYGQARQARRHLLAFMQNVIEQRQRQDDMPASKDVLGMFLSSVDEAGNPLPIGQIIDEVIQLVSAAHFTVAHALTWSIVELAAKPDLRESLRSELQQVTQGNPLKLEHLRELIQMGYFLKEIERVYSPAGAFIPRGVVEPVEYGGYLIPPGWGILVAQAATHQIPTIFDHPQKFDPSRFAPPREEDKVPYAVIGFGVGAHTCIGMEFGKMEMKIFLAKLLREFNWTLTPKYNDILPIRVLPRLEDKFRMVLMKRAIDTAV
jgi:retinoid hydroxylase